MKRILCILVLLSGVVHAQEPEANKTSKYRPHSIAISQRFGGELSLYYHTIDPHFGVYSTQFEFFTQRRRGRSQYTPMVALRLSYAGNTPNSLGGFHYGFLFGGSQYIFDIRSKELGSGWSMLANGGLTIDLGTSNNTVKINGFSIPILGGEIDFKAIYNFTREIGVTFGLNLGYQIGLLSNSREYNSTTFSLDHSFVWALNFGIIF